jgi:hypothetical protein
MEEGGFEGGIYTSIGLLIIGSIAIGLSGSTKIVGAVVPPQLIIRKI